jgi:hypothetical protein
MNAFPKHLLNATLKVKKSFQETNRLEIAGVPPIACKAAWLRSSSIH